MGRQRGWSGCQPSSSDVSRTLGAGGRSRPGSIRLAPVRTGHRHRAPFPGSSPTPPSRRSLSARAAIRDCARRCAAGLSRAPQPLFLDGGPTLSRLFRALGSLCGPLCKTFVVFGDPQHRFFGLRLGHLLGNAARLFGALPPVRGVVDEGCRHISPSGGGRDALACVSQVEDATLLRMSRDRLAGASMVRSCLDSESVCMLIARTRAPWCASRSRNNRATCQRALIVRSRALQGLDGFAEIGSTGPRHDSCIIASVLKITLACLVAMPRYVRH